MSITDELACDLVAVMNACAEKHGSQDIKILRSALMTAVFTIDEDHPGFSVKLAEMLFFVKGMEMAERLQ